MIIEYDTRKLAKNAKTISTIATAYGVLAKNIIKRLAELEAVPNLNDLRFIPQANCHMLKGQRAGHFAVDISGNFRIIFIPNHNPVPVLKDGGMDWSLITKITITEIGIDYH